jgi:hypothetical protein
MRHDADVSVDRQLPKMNWPIGRDRGLRHAQNCILAQAVLLMSPNREQMMLAQDDTI